jgi:hypothetical protein
MDASLHPEAALETTSDGSQRASQANEEWLILDLPTTLTRR